MFLWVSLRHSSIVENHRSIRVLFIVRLNATSWACLQATRLKIIFHWKAQSVICFKSSFSSPADTLISRIIENKDVSSANNLILDDKLSEK